MPTATPTTVRSRDANATLNLNQTGTTPASPPSGLNARETGEGAIRQTILTFNNVNIPITRNSTTNVYGGLEVYDFSNGIVNVLGVVAGALSITRGETTNMTTTAPLVVSLGTVTAANDATLTSTEANLLPSTSATLVGGTKTVNAFLATAAIFNGSTNNTGPIKAFLNVAADNTGNGAAANGNSSVNVSGTIVITWAPLGDFV